jgi:hypothetical protein
MSVLTPDTVVLTGILVPLVDRLLFIQAPANQPNAVRLTISPFTAVLTSINPTFPPLTLVPTFSVPLIPPFDAFAVTGLITPLSLLLVPSTGFNIFTDNVTMGTAFHI